MRRTSKPVFGASVKGEVRSGNAFSGTCRKPWAFLRTGEMRSCGNNDTLMIRGETACPAFSSHSVGSHFCRAFPETLGTLGFRNPSVFSFRLAPETPQTAVGQSWSPDGSKLINRGSCLNLSRLHGSRKVEKEKILICSAGKQGREGENLPCPHG